LLDAFRTQRNLEKDIHISGGRSGSEASSYGDLAWKGDLYFQIELPRGRRYANTLKIEEPRAQELWQLPYAGGTDGWLVGYCH
jgi:hypothetical protein